MLATIELDMPEYSIILTGQLGVGKSSLFNLIKTGVAPRTDDTRNTYEDMGLERLEHETTVNNRDVKVNLWDTGGQERYDSMTANYYRHAHAVILVYDVTAEDTLFHLTDWVKDARKNSRWGDRLVFALWGNKSDTPEEYQVTRDLAVSAFIDRHHISADLSTKVSTRIEGSVEQAFQTLIERVDASFTQVGEDIDIRDRDIDRLVLDLEEPANRPKKKCVC